MRLLSLEEQESVSRETGREFIPRRSVQLTDRHWNMRDENKGVTDVVDGPGVIGKTPVLYAGKPFSLLVLHVDQGSHQATLGITGFFSVLFEMNTRSLDSKDS